MELYASMRLTLPWVSAMKLPTTMVSAAMVQTSGSRFSCPSTPPPNTRTMAAAAAALTATLMNAVTPVGDPS
jgi:hypothetical protein